MDRVNVCLAGTGWTASNHFAGYSAIPQKACVAAVVAHSDASAARAAEVWKVKRVYRSFEEALKDDGIQAFDICTPHYHHAEMVVAALGSGRHVMVETPACTSAEECRALRIALFEHPGLKAATGHICRSWPTYGRAKQIVESGSFGKVFYLSSDYAHRSDPDEYPSARTWGRNPRARVGMGISYHSVDLLRWMAGEVEEVSGELTDRARIAVLRFREGALGHVFQSGSVVGPYSLPLHVYGESGTINCFWEEQTLKGRLHTSSDWNPEALPVTPLHGRGSPEWIYEMTDFIDSILQDGQPVCPLLEGIKTVETCMSIEEAMRFGGRVRVRYS
ncbi:MAG: Gfo/Idh/MocA family oxidoreductase [Candidatus Latescibacteria bacterium]|nr:Gfo/Idh/MocA family oxidoreductase [Candidatus Latescibacterota bacterium]